MLRETVTRIESDPALAFMPIRLHTHDELVCEVDEARADEAKAILRREMLTLPDMGRQACRSSRRKASAPSTPKRRGRCDERAGPRVLRSYQERAATYSLRARRRAAGRAARRRQIDRRPDRASLNWFAMAIAGTRWWSRRNSSPPLSGRRRSRPGRTCAICASRRSMATPRAAQSPLRDRGEREVTAIGVDLLPWLVAELADFPDDHPLFDLLIIDETSKLKDPQGKRSRALMRIAGRFRSRWGLTGTPRPNSSMDLFMPMAILTDGALWGRAFVPWRKRRFRPRDRSEREWTPLPGAEDAIAADLATVAMRVADEDMPDLPPLNVVVSRIDLPPAVMATYKTMQRQLFAAVEGRAIEAASAMVATGKCAQLANGFLYGEGAGDPVAVHDLKLEWLRELVDSLDGEPLLVAYEFVEDLRAIRRVFGATPALGGQTPGKEAARLIEAWNAGALPLLAFHPASASHGLNLQFGGARMAWLSPSWSAELTEQAIAQLYRPGQASTGHCACLRRRRDRRRNEARPGARQDVGPRSVPAPSGAAVRCRRAPSSASPC